MTPLSPGLLTLVARSDAMDVILHSGTDDICAAMDKAWREAVQVMPAPDFILVPFVRRVHRWRGRKFVTWGIDRAWLQSLQQATRC